MYYIVFGILYLISLLPMAVLYCLSDLLYFITYRIIGYRKEVVNKNLQNALPEKNEKERREIARQFYHNFWDNWVEAIKLLSISKKEISKRITADLTALEKLYASGRPCHLLLGHQFNWEWGNIIVTLQSAYPLLCVYSPQSNKVIDRLFLYLRSRFGSVLLPFNDMRRAMLPYRHKQYALALMADQSPPGPEKSYWLNFFNQRTAFLPGPERGARLGKMPVIFISIERKRRGYYHLSTSLLTENAGVLAEGGLTHMYAQALEEAIRRQPGGYLWSHKRWKHTWKEEYGKMWATK